MSKSTKMYLALFAGLMITNILSKTMSKGICRLIDDIRAEEKLVAQMGGN